MSTGGSQSRPGEAEGNALDPLDDSPPTWAYRDASDVVRQVRELDPHLIRRRPSVAPLVRITDRFLVGTLDLRAMAFPYLLEFVRCRFQKPPDLRQARLTGIEFNRCWLPGLDARNHRVDGDLVLVGTLVDGTVDLSDGDIGGSLVLRESLLIGSDGPALRADRLTLAGALLGTRLRTLGEVCVPGVRTGGDIELAGARLQNRKGFSLNGPALRVGGNLHLTRDSREGPFESVGTLSLPGARIDGDARLDNAQFRTDGEIAVDLQGARIGRVTSFHDTALAVRTPGTALNASGLITKELRLDVSHPPLGAVDLRHARCASLADNELLWNGPSRIELDDFRYDEFAEPIAVTDDARVRRRLRWLRQGLRYAYRPSPYDQLAAVLRANGNDRHAATVLMEKQQLRYVALAEGDRLGPMILLWSLLVRHLVGYGYRPARAVSALVVLLAAFVAVASSSAFGARPALLTALVVIGCVLLAALTVGIAHRIADLTTSITRREVPTVHTRVERPLQQPAGEYTEHDVVAVEAYVDTDDPLVARAVFSALDDIVEILGYERPQRETIQRGSWWRRTTAQPRKGMTAAELRAWLAKVERALDLMLHGLRQADVDVKSADAVARLVASLQDIPQACVRAGSLLLVKFHGEDGAAVVLCRHLSPLEIKALERFPEIQLKPRQALDALATAIATLEGDVIDD